MTQHLHSEYVEGCYRCDLSRDEVPPSPYVSIYLARGQAERVLKVIRAAAADLAPSNPLCAAVRRIEEACG